MQDNTPQLVSETAWELVSLVDDLRQYLENQKALGAPIESLSDDTLQMVEKWGTNAWQNHLFLGQGDENSPCMLVDSKGSFFEGQAGQLLLKILKAMRLTPESVYICNAPDRKQLKSKIKEISPKVVVTLGQKAGQMVLNSRDKVELFRGRFYTIDKVRVMPTFHPQALLENPKLKRNVWDDMQQVMKALDA